ncbi:glycosyltransferase family 2 protein [Membranihabitans maritimus]|uniref:glycosyltransferase family 2 protein n=1 Tax=Membranihabitans maritimus TaxID=2904244 RepID=UPI001F3C2811|nr:glycosyltransferase family 2 protein [Membranihabitans maritimus]
MTNISVVLITLNEADNIRDFIANVSNITDDIIVVDAQSTDHTVEIAKKYSQVSVISHPWKGFSAARNLGAESARYDWILALDADERLSDRLISEINTLSFDNPEDVYSFSFLNYIGKTPVFYGSWSGVWVKRVYNKNFSSWQGDFVHERLRFSGRVVKLTGIFHHYSYRDWQHLYKKTDRYAYLASKKLKEKGREYSIVMHTLSPVWRFVRDFVVKGGFLDGRTGLFIAINNARLVYKKYKYLKDIS